MPQTSYCDSLAQNTLKFDQIVSVKWDLSTFTWSLLQMIQSSTWKPLVHEQNNRGILLQIL